MAGKKGQISSGLVTLIIYFGFVLLLILFFFIFKLSKGDSEAKILGNVHTADDNYMLMSYLRTPYFLDGRSINTADLLAIYASEKNADKKAFYFQELSRMTKETFDPLEYCYVPYGISDRLVSGYGVFILDEEAYKDRTKLANYAGTAAKTDKKFRSSNFYDSLINGKNAAVIAVPTSQKELMYLGFFRTSINTLGRKSELKNVRDCG